MSADIAVPQHERVVSFYSRVLTTGESPLWREDLMNNHGMPVIGIGASSPEYADLPLQWMPHIQVADVARSVERALELGGSEVLHGKDEHGRSQWAVLFDPNKAAFGLIPVVSEEEIPARTGIAKNIGCISWLNLTVANASASRDFYKAVVGWAVQNVEMADNRESYADYNMLSDDGNPAGRICHARGGNLGLPPIWMLHLPVGDLSESLREVREGGGKIIKEIKSVDGGYSYAAIQDPVGAVLALVPG